MGAFYETIPEWLLEWITQQKMFFVATAPLSGNGHVNVSPKGGSYFGLLDDKTFWYMDLTGSGSETLSHLYEPNNGRITIMFNAFEGPPRIVRLWGTGRVLENHTPEFAKFIHEHDVKTIPGSRSINIVDIHQVGTSCGYSVPFYDFKDFRPVLNDHFAKKQQRYEAGNEKESMPRYWAYKNAWSIDGLPGMKLGLKTGMLEGVEPIKKMVGPLAQSTYRNPHTGFSLAQVLLIAILSAILSAFLITNGTQTLENIRANLQAYHKQPVFPFSLISMQR